MVLDMEHYLVTQLVLVFKQYLVMLMVLDLEHYLVTLEVLDCVSHCNTTIVCVRLGTLLGDIDGV